MSIKSKCFELTNYIETTPFREQINYLIESLTFRPNESNGITEDRSHFGSLARNHGSQFMGYLIIDNNRKEIEQRGMPHVPHLASSELELLSKGHALLSQIVEKCTEKIVSKHPKLRTVLDPYSQFGYPSHLIPVQDMIDISVIDPLVEEFNSCLLVGKLLECPGSLIDQRTAEEYVQIVLSLTQRINRCGVHDAPEDFKDLHFKLPTSGQHAIITRALFYFICLRNILCNICQVIYQSFINDKLPVLDKDNVISITESNSHIIGEGLTIISQPGGNEFFCAQGDLLLVKISINSRKVNDFCIVHGVTTNFHRDFGWKQEFRLRVVDEDLNSFFGLGNI